MPLTEIPSLIGNAYGSSATAGLYERMHKRHKAGKLAAERGGDVLDLSPQAPEPLQAETLQAADDLAESMTMGQSPGRRATHRLREDRVFAALAAMSALGRTGGDFRWPGGLPAPTTAEIEEAYRRLSQRLRNLDAARDPDAMQALRLELLEENRGADFDALAAHLAGA